MVLNNINMVYETTLNIMAHHGHYIYPTFKVQVSKSQGLRFRTVLRDCMKVEGGSAQGLTRSVSGENVLRQVMFSSCTSGTSKASCLGTVLNI